ncbi:PqqD family protein [Candidatus Roizmanbacteria bacterium]|nr:MAG: PqqD family protein [Candidatus Roizmanbacteria bacterium]
MAEKKYEIRKGAIVQKVPEGIIIFDAGESKLYTFNETGSIIFQSLKEKKTLVQIIASLTKEYEISNNNAKKEVKTFIQSLVKLHIVESV